MTGERLILMLLMTACSAKPRGYTDNDGVHPYYKPDQKADPEAWRDWLNPPDAIDQDWIALGQAELANALDKVNSPIVKPAKNVILFVGDGMGISTVSAARIYMAQSRQVTGDDAYLNFEKMPHTGLSRTYATDQMVPDSANTATALVCGVKCRDGVIGATNNVVRSECSTLAGNEVDSVLTMAIQEKGMVGGIVTTTRVTHATPASTYAHTADRDWEADGNLAEADRGVCQDIASQLIREERNQEIRVVLGGGRSKFFTVNETDPEYPTQTGERLDSNLIEEWKQRRRDEGWEEERFSVVYNKTDFDNVDPETTDYLMGLFEPSHMQYNADREDPAFNNWAEPTIEEMVDKAIRILRKNDNGYFLIVEGGRIDQAHHDNLAHKAINDTVAFDDAVARAVEMTNEEDTLILTTADHSHVFTMAGYGANNHDILVYDDDLKPMYGEDDKPYLTLGYTNGPGYKNHRTVNGSGVVEQPRLNLTTIEQSIDKNFVYDAGIPRSSETHAGEDVGVWARGPMAHLVHATHEQSYFAHLQMYALCVGPRKDLCDGTDPSAGNTVTAHWAVFSVALVTAILGQNA